MTHSAHAGGAILYEIATPDVGLASAGWAARAQDASTLFTNPAGMSRLSGTQGMVGGQLLVANMGFVPDANTSVSGNDGGNPIGSLPGVSAFYVHDFEGAWSAGVGALSYFGLAQEFDQGWVGRYYVEKATLLGLTLMPSVSYRVNEQWSVGAGLNAMFGILRDDVAIQNVGPSTSDGRLKLSSEANGLGVDLGVLYEISAGTRFGINYLSQVTLEFEDTPEFEGLAPLTEAALGRAGILGAELDLGMKVPHALMGSFHHAVNAEVSLMGNLGWQNWEEFGRVEVAVGDTAGSVTTDLDYQDTWHVALGAECAVADEWTVSAGMAYDSTPVETENRSVAFAVGETWRFGAGGRRKLSPTSTLGLAYTLAWGGDIGIDQFRGPLAGRVSGAFESTALHFVTVNFKWGS